MDSKTKSPMLSSMSGLIAGAAGVLIGHPLDTVKVI
jgi:hypothetical protein